MIGLTSCQNKEEDIVTPVSSVEGNWWVGEYQIINETTTNPNDLILICNNNDFHVDMNYEGTSGGNSSPTFYIDYSDSTTIIGDYEYSFNYEHSKNHVECTITSSHMLYKETISSSTDLQTWVIDYETINEYTLVKIN